MNERRGEMMRSFQQNGHSLMKEAIQSSNNNRHSISFCKKRKFYINVQAHDNNNVI